MGGCASKPKDVDAPPQSRPSEAPTTPGPDKAEGEPTHVAQVEKSNNGGEIVEEEPLVDLSEPNKEAPTIETKVVEAPTIETKAVEAPTIETKAVEAPTIETKAVEAPTFETKAVEAEVLVPGLVDDATVDKPVEEKKVETALPKHKEENAKAGAAEVAAEAVKEEQKVTEEPVGKTQGGEIMQVDDAPPPSSGDKKDVPHVAM